MVLVDEVQRIPALLDDVHRQIEQRLRRFLTLLEGSVSPGFRLRLH
jgi:hypothetical protein